MTSTHRPAVESSLSFRLRKQPWSVKLPLIDELLAAQRTRFQETSLEILLQELDPSERRLLLAHLQSDDSAPAQYLKAHLAAHSADWSAGAAAWSRFFTLRPSPNPFHLLAFSRALAESGQPEQAAAQLRRAFSCPAPYALFSRAESLAVRLARETRSELRSCRVAFLGASTTSLLVPVFQCFCLRDRIRVEVYQGLYGSFRQEILDSDSGLSAFRPAIVFLLPHWLDLGLPALSPEPETVIRSIFDECKLLWQRLSDRHGCHVVQHAFDLPASEPYGYLAAALPGGRSRVLEAVNLRLREQAPSFVSILDTPALQRQAGVAWEDPSQWYSFRQHPSTEVLPALAEAQSAHLRAVLGLTRKVLVTDLDNTLWKGIIGEDGLDGIHIGPGSPAGEAHLALQRYLLDLKSRGILLAVCSKNNPDDAILPFEKHSQMALRLSDFAAFEANWNDKASNLRAIAQKLSLGLDSFVFLDDNPLEREWIRSQLPQVAVVELGTSVFHYIQDLHRPGYFSSLTLSEEDLARAALYQSEAARESLRGSSDSLEKFLAQLQMEASAEPVCSDNLARVTQLANKTNQFNLTTRRYTEAQVRQFAADPYAFAAAFRLSDRMGSYGLIGLIFCAPSGRAQWEIETFLMSCRALGRQMERFMFDRLLEAAIDHGVRELIGVFRPTAKNSLVENLYPQLGFETLSATPAETRYLFRVPSTVPDSAPYIRNLSAKTPASTR